MHTHTHTKKAPKKIKGSEKKGEKKKHDDEMNTSSSERILKPGWILEPSDGNLIYGGRRGSKRELRPVGGYGFGWGRSVTGGGMM